jgi:hypothetical protein
MRRFIVCSLMPLILCLLPIAALALVVFALPVDGREYFLGHVTPLDWLILGGGAGLMLLQLLLGWRALTWAGADFQTGADVWLSHLAQAAEWFPLLGLLGTVAGILQTFGSIQGPTPPEKIIQLYAPAITATGAGLLMAFANILPTWTVMVGRDLIRGLAGLPAAGEQVGIRE